MEQRQKALRRKNAKRSEQEIKGLLAEYAGQECTVKEFCARYEIAEWSFYAGKKKYGSTVRKPEQAPGFVALRVQGTGNAGSLSDASLFAEVVGEKGNCIRLYQQVSPSYLQALLS